MEKMATRDAYGRALVKLGAENKDIVVLDADLAGSTRTKEFKKHYPERFFNMGIAEQNMMGTAAGLATAGKTVFASTFAIFATGRAFEQIRNSIAYAKLNVKIVASHAGLTVGEDGASHQAIVDISIMRSLPNMMVIVPADGVEAEKAVIAAAQYNGAVYIRMGRSAVPVIYQQDYDFTIGKASVLKEGQDVSVLACGIIIAESLKAAEELAQEGISVKVINVATIKPIDKEAIVKAAQETGAIVTVEEHSIIGGLGSAVAEVLVENEPVPMERVGVMDIFGESGKPQALLEKYGLTAKEVVSAVKKVLARK
ncbi:MAG: transketolase family protein [Clostridia bacterium]|nr:transketolase family protein [Clostridia bacterium]